MGGSFGSGSGGQLREKGVNGDVGWHRWHTDGFGERQDGIRLRRCKALTPCLCGDDNVDSRADCDQPWQRSAEQGFVVWSSAADK